MITDPPNILLNLTLRGLTFYEVDGLLRDLQSDECFHGRAGQNLL